MSILTSPGLLRKLLPFAAFLTAFTVVMMILILSMDFKTPRHRHIFNWTGDEDFLNVNQDNPHFIAYVREKHMKLPTYYNHATSRHSTTPPQSKYVAKLFNFKREGNFVEAGAYRRDRSSDTEWMEKELGWHGLLIQPDPRDYRNLLKQNRSKSLSINACLSPTPYPKEVTFRLSSKSMHGVKSSFTKVKCFPLLTLLLAANLTTLDYLSLDAEGAEIQVLKTLPFNRVKIEIISVKWVDIENKHILVEFMSSRQYKMIHTFNNYYLFLVNKIRI